MEREIFEVKEVPSGINRDLAGFYIADADADPDRWTWTNRGNGWQVDNDSVEGPYKTQAEAAKYLEGSA